MQFSKPMIDLIYALRRSAPSELKPSVKMANPELFDELKDYYHDSADTVSKALIKELFSLAGEEWTSRLDTQEVELPKQQAKVYRGQVRLEEKRTSIEPDSPKKNRRVYRGQVLAS